MPSSVKVLFRIAGSLLIAAVVSYSQFVDGLYCAAKVCLVLAVVVAIAACLLWLIPFFRERTGGGVGEAPIPQEVAGGSDYSPALAVTGGLRVAGDLNLGSSVNSQRQTMGEDASAVPRVQLNGDQAFHVERVTFGFLADVLCMRLINAPESTAESAIAKGVRAHFLCKGPGASGLPSLDARWSDSPQPPSIPLGETPALAVNLGINEGRQINLVVKEPEDEHCYLFNNDSYQYPRRQNPAWRMEPGEYRVVVDVSGVEVRERFECSFLNPGPGRPLIVKSFKPPTPDTPSSPTEGAP